MVVPVMFLFMFIFIKETSCNTQVTPRPPSYSEQVILYEHIHGDRDESSRALKIGDTFAPQELLPVAKRLMVKVDNFPGGKGIVSSAKSPEHLSDKLFEALFKTRSRIVTLTALDLAVLDALQALALSGEAVGMVANQMNSYVSKAQSEVLRQRKACRYRLLKKQTNEGTSEITSEQHGPQRDIKPKLSKREHMRDGNGVDGAKSHKSKKFENNLKNKNRSIKTKLNNKCRWRYACKVQRDLESCQLYAKCDDDNLGTDLDIISDVQKLEDKSTVSMQQFRKMIGLSVIDEEVEKIIERRLMKLNPELKFNGEHIETLSEYYNNVIIAAQRASTPKSKANYRRFKHKMRTTPITTKLQEETTLITPSEGLDYGAPAPTTQRSVKTP